MLATKRRMELRNSSKWMSCFVGLADSTVFEVDITPQSDGLEVLTKASQFVTGVSRNTAPRHRAHRAHRAEIHAWVLTE